MDIQEFLLARIDEDEEAARAAIDPSGWGSSPDGRWRLEEVQYEGEWPRSPEADDVIWADSKWALHANIHDPARVLRECEEKKKVVNYFVGLGADWSRSEESRAQYRSIRWVVQRMAAVYSDHPDYLQEWPT